MERAKEDRRIDVALVVGAEHHGRRGHVFTSGHTIPNSHERQRQPDADMAKCIQDSLRPEDDSDEKAHRSNYRNVAENDDVGHDRAKGGDRFTHAELPSMYKK